MPVIFPWLPRPPEYGSSEWQQLDDADPRKSASTVQAAEAWRILNSSPHVRELLNEWREWQLRRDMGESTADMAALYDWRAVANTPTFAEIERRRNTYEHPPLTPEQIKARAQDNWRMIIKGAED